MDLQREFLRQQPGEEDAWGQWKQQPGEGETGQPVTSEGAARHAGDGRQRNG